MKNIIQKLIFLFPLAFSLIACGGNSYLPNQSYLGTASGASNFTATLSWAVNTNYNSENVTGVFDPSGSDESISLQGDLSQSGVLTATGGSYTFTGSVENGILSGTFSGPTQGHFSTLDSTTNTVTQYCGSFTGSQSGAWTLQSSNNNQVSASSVSDDASSTIAYTGTLSSNAISLQNNLATASATLSGSSIDGTWNDGEGNSGTFSVSTTGCE